MKISNKIKREKQSMIEAVWTSTHTKLSQDTQLDPKSICYDMTDEHALFHTYSRFLSLHCFR